MNRRNIAYKILIFSVTAFINLFGSYLFFYPQPYPFWNYKLAGFLILLISYISFFSEYNQMKGGQT